MKKNYDPKKLSKRQRKMKKWIPDGPYCEGMGDGKHPSPCPYYHRVWSKYNSQGMECEGEIKLYNHKREECQFGDRCEKDCSQCQEEVSVCTFLNYIEYGQYPLGDMCKVCGIHKHYDWRD